MELPSIIHERPSASTTAPTNDFDIVQYYNKILALDENLAVPIAAVQSLTECVRRSSGQSERRPPCKS
ncbi:hypothetical protein CROQUDRAFT_660857 [Cronartium quercuum f. sp. fusiforme G11]|uniref:Uncharacterized protein n=1 Tax=Cronartium quercuum f. sp. fusiforme G11 TaxID=708437 RepID=A0A9P6T960_9BASI|nr:hypothetical protein CROQUDRAFT_660857 [Cronartium quercuum f. sp. fusiforme G11]